MTKSARARIEASVPFAVTRLDRIDARRYYDPQFYRAREGKALAARVADGVSPAGNREARRFLRVRDFRPIGHRRAGRREDSQGVPQPLPSPRSEARPGPRVRAGRVYLPVPRLAVSYRRRSASSSTRRSIFAKDQLAARISRCVNAGSRPGAAVRSSTSTTMRRRCASRSAVRRHARCLARRKHEGRMVVRREAAGELEARHGSIHGGLPRAWRRIRSWCQATRRSRSVRLRAAAAAALADVPLPDLADRPMPEKIRTGLHRVEPATS